VYIQCVLILEFMSMPHCFEFLFTSLNFNLEKLVEIQLKCAVKKQKIIVY